MNPVLVDVTRGGIVESRHTGAIAVLDADGASVLAIGDQDRPVFPRSAVKAFQALPLLESGLADRYAFTDAELALIISSHGGEPRHVEVATAILSKVGRDEASLECGAHWPSHSASARRLAAQGSAPGALHNNCSGKHAGFICLACGEGQDPKGYIGAQHPTMREIMGAVSSMTGAAMTGDTVGIDGCSIPTQAVSLKSLAHAYARFGTGTGLAPERARAAARLRRAAAAEPFMVAGTGRCCTDIMAALGTRAFVKTGAEGVFCAALPELGLGIALKCDDGASRASEALIAAVIGRFLNLNEVEKQALDRYSAPAVTNWNGTAVGHIATSLES